MWHGNLHRIGILIPFGRADHYSEKDNLNFIVKLLKPGTLTTLTGKNIIA